MAFSLSPSVDIIENDISLSIPNLPSAKTGMILRTDTGYANKVIPITTEADLLANFGKPSAANYMDWFNAWNFLQYASSLYVVRPMNTAVKNAGVALTGDEDRSPSHNTGMFNADVAEITLEDSTKMNAARLYFTNRVVTSKQSLGVAVCSGSNYWNAPISNEFFGIIDKDANNTGAPINLNAIGGANLVGGEIELYGTNSMKAGSQFIGNGNKLFTVKNVYSDKILVNAAITAGDISLYYGTVKTALPATTILALDTFAVVFDGTERFNLVPNVVFEFIAGTGVDVVSVLASVASINLVGGDHTVTFKYISKIDGTGVVPTTFTVSVGEIASNSEYHFFAPSSDYNFDAAQFKVPANTSTIKVEAGFNMPVGSVVNMVKAGLTYSGLQTDAFPEDIIGTDVDVYEVIAIDETNNTITVNPPLILDLVADITGKLDDIVTLATAIRGINMYSSMFDDGLIVKNTIAVTDMGDVDRKMISVVKESLVTFSKLLDYQPNWVADEFVTVVMQLNASGLYTIADVKLASYRSTARDVQNRNMFANNVFFTDSKLVYCKVNDDAAYPKVNTASRAMVRLANEVGSEVDGSFVYGTVYPLTLEDGIPVVNAAGTYTYDANAYTKADVQNAQQQFADAETFDVNILIAHQEDINGASVIAETRKDLVAIVAPYDYAALVGKSSTDATAVLVEAFGAQLMSAKQIFNTFGTYSGIYGNMKYQYDKFNDINRWMCVAGDIAGLYAQTDATRDPWWAPAGLDRGKIKNVIKLAFNANKQNRDELYVNSINPIISIAGEGAGIVMGQKTATQKPSAIDRINVRRLLIVIEKAVATAVKYALFEFNDTYTRSRLIGIIDPFLRTVKSRRGVYDYLVVCDINNNPAAILDANALVIDVFVKPTKVAEFITINMNITRSDANFQELIGKSA